MKHTAEGTPTEVLIRAMESLGEAEETEVIVIARDDQGELKFFSNLPYLTCRIGLCEGYLTILRSMLLKQETT
jgi:hypothetical protein